MQKHGLKIGVGVVSLIILIATIVMLTGKKEEEPDLSPSPSAAAKAVAFLQNTDQSDIDGTAGEETPPPSEEEEQPASTVETYMMVPGNKPPLDYTRITSSSS
jgi:hypothetical protein